MQAFSLKIIKNLSHTLLVITTLIQGSPVFPYPTPRSTRHIPAEPKTIHALLKSYQKNHDTKALFLAKRAVDFLLTPIERGGVLYEQAGDVWFEERANLKERHIYHSLDAHMQALLVISELAELTKSPRLKSYFKRGSDTLYRWLTLYDTGYWLRKDLNPKNTELLFRFANPYGFAIYPLPIHKISLIDPLTQEKIAIEVGVNGDNEGKARIAGLDWGIPERLAGKMVRRLVPQPRDSKLFHSYFYLTLPSALANNLRTQWYELDVEYYDEARANITLQQRSIAPGKPYRDLRDADLLLNGAGQWRHWIIPLRPTDLGNSVNLKQVDNYHYYLKGLAKKDKRFVYWKKVVSGYLNLARPSAAVYKELKNQQMRLPEQLAMLPICSLDHRGVLRQNQASKKTRFLPNGSYDISSDAGVPRYSPYVVAEQLRFGDELQGDCYSKIGKDKIKKQNALDYFLDIKQQKKIPGAISYQFDFDNAYNDVTTTAPWSSAFSQAYVLKELQYAVEEKIAGAARINPILEKVAYSFDVGVDKGGVSTTTKENLRFFEEVPNATHVLNAHLISVNELAAISRYLNNPTVQNLAWQGVFTLKEKLRLFDTGYWLKYDLNPKKELFFQLDWLNGISSPMIQSIELRDPATLIKTTIDVGDAKAFETTNHISGNDWDVEQRIDNKFARSFQNGYLMRNKATEGGAKHNVFFAIGLPSIKFIDFFDVPVYQMVIHYKDTAEGQFSVKIQSINEGNKLSFIPLRDGVIHTKGDQKWKKAYIQVRPQELGWYVGPEYQQYVVEQIQRIATLTNDWFFYQYAQRQKDFLETKNKGRSLVMLPASVDKQKPIPVEVINSSEVYTGFGFENAISANSDGKYVAGIEGEALAYVDLRLKGAAAFSALSIRWETADSFAKRIRVISLDTLGRSELSQISTKNGQITTVKLKSPQQVKWIRIEFSQFVGQPRLLLRKMQLWPATQNQQRTERTPNTVANFDKPYLTASDSKNPLRIFKLPITQQMKMLSDKLAGDAKSEHEKILRFMSYIGEFRTGFASDATPETVNNERIGACGTLTNLLLALVAPQSMPSRFINLMNYPKSQGHTVGEIYYDGKWHLYDPTFNAFYYSNSPSQVLSLAEIKELCKVSPESLHLHAKVFRPGLPAYTGCPIFLNASPAGPIGPDQVMFFPLEFDSAKIKKIRRKDFGTTYQGANFIGAATTNQQQEWHIKNLSVGGRYQFIIKPFEIGGDIANNDFSFLADASLQGGKCIANASKRFIFEEQKTPPWVIEFIAEKRDVVLKISHPYRGPEYRYISISSYGLSKVG